MTPDERAEHLNIIAKLVQFFGDRPEVPLPYDWAPGTKHLLFTRSLDEFRQALRAFGGTWEKVAGSTDHYAMEQNRDWHRFMLCVLREQVCKRVTKHILVPEKKITAEVVPEHY